MCISCRGTYILDVNSSDRIVCISLRADNDGVVEVTIPAKIASGTVG